MTALMQPLITTPARATVAANPQPASSSNTAQLPVSLAVSDYYQDTAAIPQYAVDDVAATTAAGIVVNYPDQLVLNPTQPATRGRGGCLDLSGIGQSGQSSTNCGSSSGPIRGA